MPETTAMQARKLRHLTELCGALPAEFPGGGTTHDFAPASKALAKPPELTWRDHAIMLLHIASSIEHALMVQYLFAAYSLGGDRCRRRTVRRSRVGGTAFSPSPRRRWGTC